MNRRSFCLTMLGLAASRGLAVAEVPGVPAAAAYSAEKNGLALLVLQNGRTLYENSPRIGRKIYSGTKAFWCLSGLAAQEEGILSLDEPVAATIEEWRGDARKSRVTIRELLDFSSGLDPAFFLHNDGLGNRDSSAISLPHVADPGSAFIYGPSSLQVFHQVMKRKLAKKDETPIKYLERRVLRRMGLGSQRYLKDRAGNPLLATGWMLSVRQWSKMGELVLSGGSPVVSRNSLAQCWRGSRANRAFSLGWWNNRAGAGGREFDFEEMLDPKWHAQNWSNAVICKDAPSDLVACIGSAYQRLYVIPSMGLIVARHGGGGRFSDARFLRLLLGT